jgi:hypothetical protein
MDCNCGILHAKTVSLGSKLDVEKLNYMGIEFRRIFSASKRNVSNTNIIDEEEFVFPKDEKSYYVGIIDKYIDVKNLLAEIRRDENTIYCHVDCCPAPPPF